MIPHPTQCPRPVFQSSGLHWGTRYEEHDWRLLSREEKDDHATLFVETWYCTKCRRVETFEREEGE
jgi:hypothetical protein